MSEKKKQENDDMGAMEEDDWKTQMSQGNVKN